MRLVNLCPPVILFIAFSLTQIIIDTLKNLYDVALFRFIVTIVFSISLNIICEMGYETVSWLFVFTPLILMTTVTLLVLFNATTKTKTDTTKESVPMPMNIVNKKKSNTYRPQNIDEKYTVEYVKCSEVIKDIHDTTYDDDDVSHHDVSDDDKNYGDENPKKVLKNSDTCEQD